LAAAEVKGESMNPIALDDYQAKIPFSDATDYDVILAHQMDGKTLTPKDKGPLFVVYPYDSKAGIAGRPFYERCHLAIEGPARRVTSDDGPFEATALRTAGSYRLFCTSSRWSW
jgi:hypothetical protein